MSLTGLTGPNGSKEKGPELLGPSSLRSVGLLLEPHPSGRREMFWLGNYQTSKGCPKFIVVIFLRGVLLFQSYQEVSDFVNDLGRAIDLPALETDTIGCGHFGLGDGALDLSGCRVHDLSPY